MDVDDSPGEDTFKVDLASDGVAVLRGKMKEKLAEFMGDLTDDSLVEYVLVLLSNGRRKDEVRKELGVFLGDDSETFIFWLWDYLSTHLHVYIQPETSGPVSSKNSEVKISDRHESSAEPTVGKNQPGVVTSGDSKMSESQRLRGRKGFAVASTGSGAFPLRSLVTDILNKEQRKGNKLADGKKVDFAHSLNERKHGSDEQLLTRAPINASYSQEKKRGRDDESLPRKRDLSSQPVVGASRRLLQFAVRDAVKTVKQASSVTVSESSSRRLRSVVSSVSISSAEDNRTQKRQRVPQAPAAALALKAAAEAAEDVNKVRSFGSVFDRLGAKGSVDHADKSGKIDKEYGDINRGASNYNEYRMLDQNEEIAGGLATVDEEILDAIDSASDSEAYGETGVTIQKRTDHLGKRLQSECSIAAENNAHVGNRAISGEQPACSVSVTPSKVVNISVNVNTWKPLGCDMPRDTHVLDRQTQTIKLDAAGRNQNIGISDESSHLPNLKESGSSEGQKEAKRNSMAVATSYGATHPMEDADCRTLYVSNVHFAATKDALSRHFNKFGAVLKVVIVTNAATGQPTGSAYVEFLNKDAAERALSLNGTSFMTRILKVVRRSSHETAQFFGWPGSVRPPLFAPRPGRIAYPRGVMPGPFRGRAPAMKTGARSLQWRREAPASAQATAVKSDAGDQLSSAEPVQTSVMEGSS